MPRLSVQSYVDKNAEIDAQLAKLAAVDLGPSMAKAIEKAKAKLSAKKNDLTILQTRKAAIEKDKDKLVNEAALRAKRYVANQPGWATSISEGFGSVRIERAGVSIGLRIANPEITVTLKGPTEEQMSKVVAVLGSTFPNAQPSVKPNPGLKLTPKVAVTV